MSSSFEDLEVWKRSCKLAVSLYQILKDSREYGLKDQMFRAAVSIASNIAEGRERNSKADFLRFLNIAKASAAEVRTQAYIAREVKIITDNDAANLTEELKIISKMVQSLINSIKK